MLHNPFQKSKVDNMFLENIVAQLFSHIPRANVHILHNELITSMFVSILVNRLNLIGIESKWPLVYWLIDLTKEAPNESGHNHHAF
jgi:hypothetical protein